VLVPLLRTFRGQKMFNYNLFSKCIEYVSAVKVMITKTLGPTFQGPLTLSIRLLGHCQLLSLSSTPVSCGCLPDSDKEGITCHDWFSRSIGAVGALCSEQSVQTAVNTFENCPNSHSYCLNNHNNTLQETISNAKGMSTSYHIIHAENTCRQAVVNCTVITGR